MKTTASSSPLWPHTATSVIRNRHFCYLTPNDMNVHIERCTCSYRTMWMCISNDMNAYIERSETTLKIEWCHKSSGFVREQGLYHEKKHATKQKKITFLLCNSKIITTFALALKKQGWLPEWPNGADCKSAGYAFGGSNPSPPTS